MSIPSNIQPAGHPSANPAVSATHVLGPQALPGAVNASLARTDKIAPRLGKIMIVDDEIANVLVAKKLLQQAGYSDFETTTDSAQAYGIVQATRPDVVLLDINMPEISGVEILRMIRSNKSTRHLPVLILTANSDSDIKLMCLELGATDFLVKPVDPMELVPRVRNALLSKQYQDQLSNYAANLEEKVRQRTHALDRSRREVIYCLARAAEMRDNDTGNHVIRVGRYAGIIATNMGLPKSAADDIELAAQLHDVGKIAIPDAILLKPDKLLPEEFEIIKKHVHYGCQIVQPFAVDQSEGLQSQLAIDGDTLRDGSRLMRLAANIAQTHHEKFDGTGYPIGLAGEQIPLEGRITAVADVYDALSTERPYKKALPSKKCFEILEEGRGKHFDPDALDAIQKGVADILRVQVEFMDV